jgi:hypothetical protein
MILNAFKFCICKLIDKHEYLTLESKRDGDVFDAFLRSLNHTKKSCRIVLRRERTDAFVHVMWLDHMIWMLEKLERFAVAFYRRICALSAVDCKPKMVEA